MLWCLRFISAFSDFSVGILFILIFVILNVLLLTVLHFVSHCVINYGEYGVD